MSKRKKKYRSNVKNRSSYWRICSDSVTREGTSEYYLKKKKKIRMSKKTNVCNLSTKKCTPVPPECFTISYITE